MHPVHLIHWQAEEAEERADRLRAAGYEATFEPLSPSLLKTFKDHPPAALVIDLSRLPSQGRDVGLHLRKRKATRHIPLVFVEGKANKVARVRKLIPDAQYTTWSKIGGALRRAISNPPDNPTVPDSVFDAYAETPLPKKASAVSSDLSQSVVRRAGLDAGLMDFKICRVDDTWSALRFTIPRDSAH